MGNSDETRIKQEIDTITENIDTILKKIDAAMPAKTVETEKDSQESSADGTKKTQGHIDRPCTEGA